MSTTYRYRTTSLARLQARGFRPFTCAVDALRETIADGEHRTVWERIGHVHGRVVYRSTLLRRVGNDLWVVTSHEARHAVVVFPGGRGRTIETVTA